MAGVLAGEAKYFLAYGGWRGHVEKGIKNIARRI
jgi:hypothetical protein